MWTGFIWTTSTRRESWPVSAPYPERIRESLCRRKQSRQKIGGIVLQYFTYAVYGTRIRASNMVTSNQAIKQSINQSIDGSLPSQGFSDTVDCRLLIGIPILINKKVILYCTVVYCTATHGEKKGLVCIASLRKVSQGRDSSTCREASTQSEKKGD